MPAGEGASIPAQGQRLWAIRPCGGSAGCSQCSRLLVGGCTAFL